MIAMTLESIPAPQVYRQVAEQIVRGINSGTYPPGARLPAERTLAKMFNVSRSSIREALIVLETEHRIEVRGGAGVFVSMPEMPSALPELDELAEAPGALDVFQARSLIEPAVAALAAINAQDGQISALHRALGDMFCSSPDDPGYIEFDRMFHMLLAESCGNSSLYRAMEALWHFRTDKPYMELEDLPYSPPVWQSAVLEHREILIAVSQRDAQAAHSAMRRHLDRALTRLSAGRIASNSADLPARASA